MAIYSVTSAAKCKDCIYCKPKSFGKLNRNICTNEKSGRFNADPKKSMVSLKDLVCNVWKLF